jgi:hypothetical protein
MSGSPPKKPVVPRYTIEELLVGMTPEALSEAFEWGADVGREVVEHEPSEQDSRLRPE